MHNLLIKPADLSVRKILADRLTACRATTVNIGADLEIEDFVVQPTPEVSPLKWHLGHTTWFFEELILAPYFKNYARYNPQFNNLFNSYYKSLGTHWTQGHRGDLSRPTVAQVLDYRFHIDDALNDFMNQAELTAEALYLIEVGINHEQQHQELLYMDIKYILGVNRIETQYSLKPLPKAHPHIAQWREFHEGIFNIGSGGAEFSFDNERPRHKTYLYPFAICDRLITNGDYLEFIEAGGYANANLWLSQGWDWVNATGITRPLYWREEGSAWLEYTLHGLRALDPNSPVAHISYFEADAFARWRGLRLPTEQELEVYLDTEVKRLPQVQDPLYHPTDAQAQAQQVWCWTMSQYSPYPQFQPFRGSIHEYNGKFMCNQFVLKGGCVVTPYDHYRNSYRNFYEPQQRWMFSGIRLARDL